MKSFQVMKAPNEELIGKTAYDKACTLTYPKVGSFKLDGFRSTFYQALMRTASLKPFKNIHINEKFAPIVEFIKKESLLNPLADGELLAPSTPFNVFSGIFRSDEMELPEDTKFFQFDGVTRDEFNKEFIHRQNVVDWFVAEFPDLITKVEQKILYSPEDVIAYYEQALAWVEEYEGEEHFVCDGLILREPSSYYKFGRATMKQALIWKLKPYQTFDAKIIGLEEGTYVDPKVPKTRNEMNRSVTSKKKADRILGGYAKNFLVIHDGIQLAVQIKEKKEKKIFIWNHPETVVGKTIEYKGLMVGAKDLPRHATQARMRPDKD